MDTCQTGRPLLGQRRCNDRAPVPALGNIAIVTKPSHQLGPRYGDAGSVPTAFSRFVGKCKSWQRWRNNVERFLFATTMRRRIRQGINDLEELDHRAWPSVRNDDRQRVRMTRSDVQEVNV